MFHITSFGDRTRPQYQLIIIGQAKQTTNELNVRSPIGFFNPVIPTQNSVQSRNPDGYFDIQLHGHTFNPETCLDFAL